MKKIFKITVLAAAAVAATLTVSGCSSVSTDANEVAVHVNDYNFIPTDKSIAGCVKEGTQEYHGPGDNYYKYPAGERSYKFSSDKGSDGGAVSIVKGNIPLTITGVVTFSLNGDCDTLKQFHKLIGSKSWDGHPAYVNDDYKGWDAMLDTYIEQSVQSAATAASSQITADYLSIYNGAGRGDLETAMQKLLPVYVKQLSGGNFFINFRLVVNKPTINNPDILNAIASKTVAQLQNEAQLQKNAAVQTELQSIKQLVAVLGRQGYIDYVRNQLTKQQLDLLSQAIDKGDINVLPIPQGSTLTVPSSK